MRRFYSHIVFVEPGALHLNRRMLCLAILLTAGFLVLSSIATAAEYQPVSTTIHIPVSYTRMLVPTYQGQLRTTAPYGPVVYPSTHQNMQFMAFLNPTTHAIMYVQTKDPDGRYFEWRLYQQDYENFALVITTYVMDSSSGFPAELVETDNAMTATGDTAFYKAVARKYKNWAIQQKWAKRRSSSMDHMATIAIAPDFRQITIENKIIPYVDMWDGEKTGCWVTHWRAYWQYGVDGAVPDYRKNSSASNAWLTSLSSDHNCETFAYVNALLWDSGIVEYANPTEQWQVDMNEVYVNNPVARYDPADMIMNQAGARVAYSNDGTASGLPLRYFSSHWSDPSGASRWEDAILTGCNQIKSYGFTGIYFDMAAFNSPVLDYDPAHGDQADPLVWQNGLRDLMQKIHDQTGLKIITEGNAEIYMDLVDGYLAYSETGALDGGPGEPLIKQVPLFREVYGEVARCVGWQILPTNMEQTLNDLTPADLADAMNKAANFGSLCYASPAFIDWNPQKALQDLLMSDGSYAAVFGKLSQPLYKKVYEQGGGASNWTASGGAAPLQNVVDNETGTAAVFVNITDRNSGQHCDLYMNESNLTHTISWDMKLSAPYYIDVFLRASDGNYYYLVYDPHSRDYRSFDLNYVKIGLGFDTADGKWRTICRDLNADFQTAYPSLTVNEVISFKAFAAGLIDNVALLDAGQNYEDGAGSLNWTPTVAGISASTVVDGETGSACVQFTGIENRDASPSQYFSLDINDSQRFEIAWDMKINNQKPYYVVITVAADDGYWYDLLYDQHAYDFRETVVRTVKVGLGAETTDGKWRTFRRNLADDLYYGTGLNITSVVHMRVYASASIDNVTLFGNGLRTAGNR